MPGKIGSWKVFAVGIGMWLGFWICEEILIGLEGSQGSSGLKIQRETHNFVCPSEFSGK